MKKKFIYIIIFTISIALIGLVGIQLYWINTAIKVKEARFRQTINEAVSRVVFRLEKIETAEMMQKQMQFYNNLPARMPSVQDSTNKNIYYRNSFQYSNRYTNDSIYKSSREQFKVGYQEEENGKIIEKIDTNIVRKEARSRNEIAKPKNRELNAPDSTMDASTKNQHLMQNYIYRANVLNDIFEDMMNLDKRMYIEKRVPPKLIDSLLKQELQHKGISTKFEYGLFSADRNKLVYETSNDYTQELLKNSYSFLLYPNDLFGSRNYLLIYFPNQKGFLLTQMWVLLMISAILIIVIILSFFLTIHTIFRQKKLSEMKNDFINNMTHEFKTPISTISLACEALNDSDVKKSDDIYKSYINVINDENKRLGILAEKVLQTAVIEKGGMKIRKDRINLKKIIGDVIKGIKIQVEKKGGEIQTNLQAEDSDIYGDKVHISNVFYNLLDNAIKYSNDIPKISVFLENGGNYLLATVKDNGIGISKAHQKKIFDKLYRVSTGNLHNVKGFGLGLSYVKAIVEKHDGHIDIESELEKGTTIKVKLPIFKEK